jgi:hypothetical protein
VDDLNNGAGNDRVGTSMTAAVTGESRGEPAAGPSNRERRGSGRSPPETDCRGCRIGDPNDCLYRLQCRKLVRRRSG